jgi:hypothetical protein
MEIKKKISNIHLSKENERNDISISIEELSRQDQHNKYLEKVDTEQYKRISLNCLTSHSAHNTTEKVSNEFPLKVFFVFFTVLLTYYSIYYLAYAYVKNSLTEISFNLLLFILISVTLFIFILFIYKKDFGKVQFFIYSAIYMVVSLLGVLSLILNTIPFSSYQIINLFVIILFIQTMIFILTVPITRKIVCRIDRRSHEIKSVDF